MHEHAKTEQERRVALGWIGRQLAWESRLQTLRDDPQDKDVEVDLTADEVDSAA
jgi:hypothetical protein